MRSALKLAAFVSLLSVSSAQVELIKLTASDAGPIDHFGWSVSISDDRAIIAAPWDDDLGPYSGSVYVIDVTTGQELFKLTALDGTEDAWFGSSVAISGDRAVVGATYDEDLGYQSGSAYVFDVMTGQELFKLTASDGAPQHFFGWSVSLSGDRAIVGAYGSASGSAYVFDVTTGQELFKLIASDAAPDDRFGFSVAISGNLIIVGVPNDDALGSASGSAYVFDVTTGQELYKISASDGVATDRFGRSVAISGNRAIVGAIYDDDLGTSSGSAYVFDVTTGQELFKLTASDGGAFDAFGRSVAISGNRAVVGASLDDDLGSNSGSAYVFDVTTGQELYKITASDGAQNDFFGWSVATGGALAVVGANADDGSGSASGSAYVFGFGGPIGTNYCGPANLNSSGLPATIAAQGFVEVQYNAVTMTAAQLPMNVFGYFLNSDVQGFKPFPPGSSGNLCLGGGIGRHAKQIGNSGAAGKLVITVDLTALPRPGGTHSVVAGETWNFQAWFRDKNPGNTSNFTDGIEIVFN